MPYVKSSIVIKGEGERIYDVIKDMASYPNFMKDVVSVDILERGEAHTVSHWVTNADGREIVWTERDNFYPDELRITYAQLEGDLKKLEGAWSIEQEGDAWLVSLIVDFEFGIPMIAGLLNPLLRKKVRENSENMLQAIKKQIEK